MFYKVDFLDFGHVIKLCMRDSNKIYQKKYHTISYLFFNLTFCWSAMGAQITPTFVTFDNFFSFELIKLVSHILRFYSK
jgi:hypothetical protein